MNAGWSGGMVAAGFAVAGTLFLLELLFSAGLLSIAYLSRVAVRRLSQESGGRLRFLEELKDPQSTYRMAAQLARQVSLLSASVVTGMAARGAGLPHPWLLGVFVGSALGVLLLETFAARGLAQHDPRAALRLTAPLLRLAHAILYPLLAPPAAVLRRLGPAPSQDDNEREEDQDEEIDALIEVGEREGLLEADEGEMMRSIADLADTSVREIMTPRTDIDAFPAETTVANARRVLSGAAHSRFPVYRETIDNVVGILHARDLFRAWNDGKDEGPITAYVRPAFFVPETQPVSQLLTQMRQRTHIALVVDEYGGIAGLVTLEDLLEEIVGDIRDEHDEEEALVEQESEGVWLVNGLVHVEQLEEMFGLAVGERDFDTVGGLVVSGFGRVPAEGETLEVHGLRIEVVQADRRRVYKVRVRATPTREAARVFP